MIQVANLTKRYGDVVAVRDVTFSVERGEIVGFLGPNGAGKTTTMRILAGYLSPSAGNVRVAGFDVFESPLEVKRRIGYLPEHPPVYPEMRVRGYLEFVARIQGVASGDLGAAVNAAMEKAGVAHHDRTIISTLSKGYRQRVGLAQALVHDPELLVLDEPTIGLDPAQLREFRDVIRALAGDHTVLLSTHILPEVEATCSRVIIIKDGEIRAEDTPERLRSRRERGARLVVRAAGDSERIEAAMSAVPGVVGVTLGDGDELYLETGGDDDPASLIARAVIEGGFELLELRREAVTLEDIFVELTTEEAIR